MKNTFACFFIFAFSLGLYAQDTTLNAKSFDFWVGEWNLSWTNKQGEEVQGQNSIERILNGNVIQENFRDPKTGFEGKSWSTFSRKTQSWHQTWVDNGGGYLEFDGQRYGDTLAFVMDPYMVKGVRSVKRMIFYNITSDSFTWDWQAAPEGSNEWQLLWRIHYKRRK